MVDFMKEIVVTVILQELLSRAISFALEKRKEKVSQEKLLERIRTSVDDMEFALERSRKLPITDISLLRRRKQIQAACTLGRRLLNTDQPEQEVKNQPGVPWNGMKKVFAMLARMLRSWFPMFKSEVQEQVERVVQLVEDEARSLPQIGWRRTSSELEASTAQPSEG